MLDPASTSWRAARAAPVGACENGRHKNAAHGADAPRRHGPGNLPPGRCEPGYVGGVCVRKPGARSRRVTEPPHRIGPRRHLADGVLPGQDARSRPRLLRPSEPELELAPRLLGDELDLLVRDHRRRRLGLLLAFIQHLADGVLPRQDARVHEPP